uniref:Uncharacterized protein n=1 Tax=viral metagenome TaxID=1070528 RepID=A0A6C0IXN0_9ZZZZ
MNDIFNIDLDEYEDAISDCLDRLNKWRPQLKLGDLRTILMLNGCTRCS